MAAAKSSGPKKIVPVIKSGNDYQEFSEIEVKTNVSALEADMVKSKYASDPDVVFIYSPLSKT